MIIITKMPKPTNPKILPVSPSHIESQQESQQDWQQDSQQLEQHSDKQSLQQSLLIVLKLRVLYIFRLELQDFAAFLPNPSAAKSATSIAQTVHCDFGEEKGGACWGNFGAIKAAPNKKLYCNVPCNLPHSLVPACANSFAFCHLSFSNTFAEAKDCCGFHCDFGAFGESW